VLNATAQWQERGQLNFGVYEITGSDGVPVVLKIVDGGQFWARDPNSGLLLDFDGELRMHGGLNASAAAFREYVDLHTLLGRMHVAPKLIAVIGASSLKAAARSHWAFLKEVAEELEFDTAWIGKPRLAGDQAVGVVMQKLPLVPEQGPLHPLNRPLPPHPFLTHWTSGEVEKSIRDLIEIRHRVIVAGAHLIDRQFVVTPSAEAYLLDLDQARFDPEMAVKLDISTEIVEIISRWRVASGGAFEASVRDRLLHEAAKSYEVCRSDRDFEPLLSDWRSCERKLLSSGGG
jgi:hypothetical protein